MGFCGKLKRAEQGKLKQWYGNGLLWKIETVVLKWAEQRKLKQWYRNGLLQKVETVLLKQAEQGKLKQSYGNGLLQKFETGRAGEVKTMVQKWAFVENLNGQSRRI